MRSFLLSKRLDAPASPNGGEAASPSHRGEFVRRGAGVRKCIRSALPAMAVGWLGFGGLCGCSTLFGFEHASATQSCAGDADCPPSEKCVEALCRVPCATNADCAAGTSCAAGACDADRARHPILTEDADAAFPDGAASFDPVPDASLAASLDWGVDDGSGSEASDAGVDGGLACTDPVTSCTGDGAAGQEPACCGGSCIDLATDPQNCGQCQMTCAPFTPCIGGQCAYTWGFGWGDAGPGTEPVVANEFIADALPVAPSKAVRMGIRSRNAGARVVLGLYSNDAGPYQLLARTKELVTSEGGATEGDLDHQPTISNFVWVGLFVEQDSGTLTLPYEASNSPNTWFAWQVSGAIPAYAPPNPQKLALPTADLYVLTVPLGASDQ